MDQKAQVESLASFGLTQEQIASFLKISRPTLRKYCSEYFERGKLNARILVTQALFSNIKKGREASIFFWLKCQGRWSEKAGDISDTIEALPNITVTVKTPARLKENDPEK